MKSKKLFGKKGGEDPIEEESKTDPLHIEARRH